VARRSLRPAARNLSLSQFHRVSFFVSATLSQPPRGPDLRWSQANVGACHGARAHRGESTAMASISNMAPWTASSEMATSVLAGGADRLRCLFRTSLKVDKCAISVR
jgi:hypothetical protein